MPPRELERKHSLELINQTGNSEVYEFEDETGEPLIAKVATKQDSIRKLEREARTLDRLDGIEGVPTLLDVIEEPGQKALVMTKVKGESLKSSIGMEKDWCSQPLEPEHAVEIASALAQLLGEINDRGILYRDFNLDHIIIGKKGEIGLVDFEAVDKGAGPDDIRIAIDEASGETIGTWEMMAPEEFAELQDGLGSAATNVYSVGMALHQMVYGRPAHKESSRKAIHKSHRRGVGKLDRVTATKKLERVIEKASQPKAKNRYKDCHELARALNALGSEDLRSN